MSPISRENRARYPKNWRDISRRVRERAFDRCECDGRCGQEHPEHAFGHRCAARHGFIHPETLAMVVLTVAHLDHTPENCAQTNLMAMCQRCHNRYDREHRNKSVKRTLRAKRCNLELDLGRAIGEEE